MTPENAQNSHRAVNMPVDEDQVMQGDRTPVTASSDDRGQLWEDIIYLSRQADNELRQLSNYGGVRASERLTRAELVALQRRYVGLIQRLRELRDREAGQGE